MSAKIRASFLTGVTAAQGLESIDSSSIGMDEIGNAHETLTIPASTSQEDPTIFGQRIAEEAVAKHWHILKTALEEMLANSNSRRR